MRVWVDGSGRWSGGGNVVLSNLRQAALEHPDVIALLDEPGAVRLVPRNVPVRLRDLAEPFVWMPQNALPWGPPAPGERRLQLQLRVASEIARRQARAMVRICAVLPASRRNTSPVLHNVLDAGFDAVTDWPTSGSSGAFFASGSAHSYRKYDGLLRGYASYRAGGGRTSLVLQVSPGTPAVQESLRRLSAADGVQLRPGGLPRADVVRAMRASRGVLFPSAIEASPVTLLEAVAVGAPTACNNIDGHRALAAPGSAWFDVDDPTTVARALAALDDSPATSQNPLSDPAVRAEQRSSWAAALADFLRAG
ncbi:glycosyltransferase [Angustibacter sp. McL0619]|uniref:glycosyltransferase n=1 Tax=Angustibacter sp. McL0619 TaxID=3415676 RepID=UPI003CEE7CCF